MQTIMALLSLPLMLLNLLGGLVSAVWLIVLGQWWAIGYGILGLEPMSGRRYSSGQSSGQRPKIWKPRRRPYEGTLARRWPGRIRAFHHRTRVPIAGCNAERKLRSCLECP